MLFRSPEIVLAQALALSKNVSADVFLTTFLRSFAAAPTDVQANLTPHLSTWFLSTGLKDAATKLVTAQREDALVLNTALKWLALSGVDMSSFTPVAQGPVFHSALRYGNDIQASYHGFWYNDHRRRQMTMMGFLTDNDLPWEGSIKDVFAQPERSPDALRAKIEGDDFDGGTITDLSGAAFKHAILHALEQNRKQHISLPADFVPLRDLFAKAVLTLPDQPDTPRFTLADFDVMARTGQNVEALRRYEQQYGKRARLRDGREIRVINPEFGDFDD